MPEYIYHQQDLSDKTFLVTGGAGFIGSHIVAYLLKHGARKVRVLDNFSTGFYKNIEVFRTSPAFELLEGDITDLTTCQKAMDGIAYVSHQAALGSVPRSIADPITTNKTNIDGFLNILVAARDAGVKAFVYAASSSTYGDHPALPKKEENIGRPLSPYAVSKYVNELYAGVFSLNYGFHSIGLRYFNIFGSRQNPKGPYAAALPLFIEAALQGKMPIINGDGETSRDFTYVENAVQANIKALLLEKLAVAEVLNIACGQQTSLNQLWQRVAEITGSSLKPIYREERKGDVRHSLADISKAKSLLGYTPLISVEEGLKLAVEWYRRERQKTEND